MDAPDGTAVSVSQSQPCNPRRVWNSSGVAIRVSTKAPLHGELPFMIATGTLLSQFEPALPMIDIAAFQTTARRFIAFLSSAAETVPSK
jgi:hypothetical protein